MIKSRGPNTDPWGECQCVTEGKLLIINIEMQEFFTNYLEVHYK